MANVLMQPVSGAIQFNEETAGSSTVPNLSSDGIKLSQVDSSGLQIESHYGGLTGGTRFSIQGDGGQLLAVTDSLTGDIFSVNDASGLPIINVNSCVDDVITMGTFNTNALVVSGSVVGIGVADPDSKFEVKGAGCGSSTAVMRVRNCADTELFRVQDNGGLRVGDGTNIYLWNSNDANFINYANWVASTGSQQVIQNNGVGGIHLKANGTDSDIIFSASDGSLNEIMRIDGSTGNVSIGGGTTTPDKTLVVRGASAEVVIDDTDTTDTPRLRFRESGSTSSSVRTDACNLIFETGTTEAARFDTNGTLEIKDSIKFEANSYSQGTGTMGMLTNDILYIRGGSSGTLIQDNDGSEGIRVGGGYVSVETGSVSNRMRINSTGVGLGTATPTEALTVMGNITGSGNITTQCGTMCGKIVRGTSCVVATKVDSQFQGNTAEVCITSGCQGCVRIGTHNAFAMTLSANSAGTPRVGIGTATPSSPLHISSDDNIVARFHSTDANATLYLSDNGTSNFSTFKRVSDNLAILENGGSVGIGTTSPSTIFEVKTNDACGNKFGLTGDGSTTGAALWTNWTTGASYLDFRLGGTSSTYTKMRIDQTGRVGIGTTTLPHTLSVKGTISRLNSSGIQVANLGTSSDHGQLTINNSGGTNRVTLNSNGDSYFCCNVIIGSSSPVCGNNLEVVGSAYISNNLNVDGTLAKCGGSFNINHPLPALSASKRLVHSFVEAPGADNIYTGTIGLTSGSATVNIDKVSGMTEGTYVALNRCSRVFTTNETNWDPVKGSISGNTLTIESCISNSSATVSWMVIGERQDPYMMSADTTLTDSNGKVIVEPDIELF